ncbi:MAG TPA: glycosyltransferase [Myxococcota bacterium]|nr:glycosyltransferase [Myxococcota bacterium]
MRTLALVVGRYPTLSQTFIRREVAALRELGVPVQTCSIHRSAPEELLAEADREEATRTLALRPTSLSTVRDALLSLRRIPGIGGAAAVGLASAAAQSVTGYGRNPVYPFFYWAEAVLHAGMLGPRRVGHVHAHFANAGGEVARAAARMLGAPFSLTLHGYSDLEQTHPRRLAALVTQARFVACVSDAMREAVAARVPDVRNKLHVVRCGLDAAGLALAARASAPGANAKLRFLHVGRLSPEKDQALLLDAFADALGSGLDAGLRIVGEGPEHAALAQQIVARGLAGRAELVGPLAGAALTAEYAAADLFVMSSRIEGLPVVLMEALAQGVPCIAPAVGGIPELITDANGWLFPAGDRAALAARLLAAQQARASLAARGAAGRAAVLAAHDVRKCAAALRDLIAPALA